ncbi:helix-turn-helix domain-containing protein [Sphingobium sp. JS3065]|jgi:DNA-binding IclR family transcriptional regulator|uniref:IclR family transcriptional regulator n=1 Tax=Sphingobium sp. JS3065 TaxID=2970925 RepID=UPI0022656C7E|nr:helix-turn-helix domain-containing protein [Sphingobium sp. JS3065]UZW56392.1 helix-turn-helix domain-containing protein [Sphingobium sp. JS3065]
MDAIKSAKRTLELFELFADIRRPARVVEIQNRLDLPQSSTSKLLRMFVKMGYLQYDPAHRTFYPTLRVTLLGGWLHDQWFGHDSLLMTMESLREKLGTSVLLGIQNDKHVLYMLALQALVQPRPPLATGTLRPICRAAAGKALLMHKAEGDIGRLVRRINAEEPDSTLHVDLKDLLADLAECRARGYALSEGAIVASSGVVAMPLPRLPGQPAMALGVGAPLDWLRENVGEVVETLRSQISAMGEKSGE